MTEQTILSDTEKGKTQALIDSSTSLRHFLDEETHWERAAKTRMGKYLTRVETEFIMTSVNLTECNLLLDVGAEAGRFSMLAVKKNIDVVALDIDLYALKKLKLKNRLVNVILADARHIPLREKVLDTVFMIEVLDYIPEVETAIFECNRTLKSEGQLLVSFGNRVSIKSILKQLQGKPYLHSYRNVIFSLQKLGKIVRKVGYSWLPFGRTSQNSSIPLLSKIERLLGLRKLPEVSPWVIVHAMKTG